MDGRDIILVRIEAKYEIPGNPWAYEDLHQINERSPEVAFYVTDHVLTYNNKTVPLGDFHADIVRLTVKDGPLTGYLGRNVR
ncbi:MAG: hypothetical protein D9V47_08705 [Clostridia bacterium]|nr:MAG: hypothetical protein D9V47_08705 [Clostridia bacterium]